MNKAKLILSPRRPLIALGLGLLVLGVSRATLVGAEAEAPAAAEPAAEVDAGGKKEAGKEVIAEEKKEAGEKPAAGKKDGAGAKEAVNGEAKPEDAKPVDPDDAAAAENAEAEEAAVARPVSADLVRVYGWREYISVKDVEGRFKAKLDTGALTSSIHAEEKELFERDGKKWVRFIVTDPSVKKPGRTRIEAPLVRIAKIKEPGGKSEAREVVRLSFQIGERNMRGEFTLNNRANMLSPVLLGRSLVKDLGWVDASRTHLAGKKVAR